MGRRFGRVTELEAGFLKVQRCFRVVRLRESDASLDVDGPCVGGLEAQHFRRKGEVASGEVVELRFEDLVLVYFGLLELE